MDIAKLIARLVALEVRVELSGDKLKVSAPKGRLSKDLQHTIANNKSHIIEFLRSASERLPEIIPDVVNKHEPFPLNPIQQAYWIGRSDAAQYGNVACHYYTEHESNDLDFPRFNRAWQKVIAANDMLRAVVHEDGRQQILQDVPEYNIRVIDLSEHSEESAEPMIQQVRNEMSHQVLSPHIWPLFDVRVHRLSNDRYRIHFSFDLLIADVMSLFSTINQWHSHYSDPNLAVVNYDLSFRDYILAQQDFYQHGLYQRSLAYWRKRLAKLPAAPELPLAQIPKKIKKPKFKRIETRISADDWGALQAQCQNNNVTISMVMCTVFAEVIARWSKNQHFTLNTTLFNRLPLHPEVNNIVGDFTSLNLLEIDCRSQQTFLQRVEAISQQFWQDMEYRYVHGVDVMRELSQAQGAPALMPIIFTSTLGSHDLIESFVTFEQWFGKPNYSITQTPQLWLDFQIWEEGDELGYNWDVVDGLFHEKMLEDMFAEYDRFLRRLIADPTAWQTCSDVTLSSDQLMRRRNYNARQKTYPSTLMHSLFNRQAQANPERKAVIFDAGVLSYGELFTAANRLARRLQKMGAKTNGLIAVVMDRGWEQVLATLAILNSGAAYLPIDPKWPQQRIAEILAISDVSIVLTQSWVYDSLTWSEGLQCLSLDQNPAADESSDELPPIQKPDDLAYVIFTSGSTGTPKGVMIDHQGAVNTLLAINERFKVGENDCVFGISALNFDLSVYDIFGTLAAGAALVIPQDSDAKDPQRWLTWMDQAGVTIWNSVPALMKMLVESAAGQGRDLPPALRVVMMSGDWIPISLPDKIRRLSQSASVPISITSLGGATEASIWSIVFSIDEVDSQWPSIPYGYPLENQRCYVLNERLEDCPDWVTGDFYIAGIGLAKGYWKDDEKTAASFITHPSSGERLYKTGDLARFLPQGYVEFLGREDGQVKVQGYRIELGEIETHLNTDPSVHESVVMVHKDSHANQRLVAYIVATEKKSTSDTVLSDASARALFKLEQRGRRRFSEEYLSVALPFCASDVSALELNLSAGTHRPFIDEAVSLDNLSQLLSPLRQVCVEGSALPKYAYPSAGSLYPIQIYLYVFDEIEDLSCGAYYYEAELHRLIHLPGKALPVQHQNAGFMLCIVANLDAIQPLYGEITQSLCALEVGYIHYLLDASASLNSLALQHVSLQRCEATIVTLELSPAHKPLLALLGGRCHLQEQVSAIGVMGPLASAPLAEDGLSSISLPLLKSKPRQLPSSFLRRQSYRSFSAEQIPMQDLSELLGGLAQLPFETFLANDENVKITLYIYVKPHRMEGLAGGLYRYDSESHSLHLVSSADMNESVYSEVNCQLYKASAFAIYLMTDSAHNLPDLDRSDSVSDLGYMHAGAIGQALTLLAPESHIGVCPIGGLDQAGLFKSFDIDGITPALDSDKKAGTRLHVCHSFLAGKITPAQMSVWLPEEDVKKPLSPTEILQAALKRSLPEYMVPAKFVFLDSIPLSANGKVDRKALPDPDLEEINRYVAPKNDTEVQLIALWKKLLGVDNIGIHHNFFEIGGNSLLAIQVQQNLKDEFLKHLPIVELFKNPTIAALAQYLDEQDGKNNTQQENHQSDELRSESDRRKQALLDTQRGRYESV